MKLKEIEKLAESNKHLSSWEIKQDILDTEVEIVNMEIEAKHLATTPMGMREARWNHMRADARESGIKNRKKFIEQLKAILSYRENFN